MEAYSKEEDRRSLANLTNHGNSKLFETRSLTKSIDTSPCEIVLKFYNSLGMLTN